MKTVFRYFLTVLVFVIVGLALSGCGSEQQKGGKPSADWSRSLSLGEHVAGTIGLAVDEDNQEVYVVWPASAGQDTVIGYTRIDQYWDPILTSELPFPGQLKAPRLLLAGDERLHLFWASRVSGDPGWALWHAFFGVDGELDSEPRQISTTEGDVREFAVAPDLAGGAVVSWTTRGPGDLYLLHMSQDGTFHADPLQIASRVESPSLRVDPVGDVHLAWRVENSVFYSNIPLDDLSLVEGRPVAVLIMGTGDSLTGPVLGLSEGWVYILWSILSQSGLEAGTARTEYIAFSVEAPGKSTLKPVWILPVEEQPYAPYSGSLGLTQLVKPPPAATASTDFILHPEAMMAGGSELVVALSANQRYRLDVHLQIVMAVFDDGQFQGYSFVSKTQQLSDRAAVSVGPSGNIYAAWREGARGQDVYYATTESAAVIALDRLNPGDFVTAILQGGMESLVGIAFMPFVGFGWILPGLIVVGLWKLFKDQENVTEWSSWIPLLISFGLYFVIKTSTLPTMMTYVPFSAWIHIPGGLETPLMIGVPVVIFIISALVANQVRLKYSESAVVFYISFTLTDALLTLSVYGVNLLGVF